MSTEQKSFGANMNRATAVNQNIPIPHALAFAAEKIDKGELQVAEGVVRQVLEKQPENPHANHLLGIIAHRVGRTELALDLVGKAIEKMPNVAQFHANRGEMCRILKRMDEAVIHGEKAVKLDPKFASAHSNLGIAYYDLKEYEKAQAQQEKALKLSPDLIPALNNLGSIKRANDDRPGAVELYRRVLAISPNHLESINNLGALLIEENETDEAIATLIRALKLQPNYAEAHNNIGNAFIVKEDYDKAFQAYNKALSINNQYPEPMLGLARVYKEKDKYDDASLMVKRALEINPDKAEAYCMLGDIHFKKSEYPESEDAYRKALDVEEELLGAHLGIGQVQMELGNLQEAEEKFNYAIELKPDEIAPYVLMAQVRKIKKKDPVLKRLEEHAKEIEDLPETRAMSLHFALGKAFDDVKDYDKAFPHFSAGCRIKRSKIDYSSDAMEKNGKSIREFFTEEQIERLRGGADGSGRPIFVLGMPRSGTTLVETILASHPEVFGGGELRDLLKVANQPKPGVKSEGFPMSMQGMRASDIREMGERYLACLRKYDDQTAHITDKMPANFIALGLIHLMLPDAKIVHVMRNSADICLSNFSKNFNNSQYHSYDLEEMARYYVNYAKMMEHWRKVLPKGAFYEVQYEQLVSDPEAQTRALIDYCGLEWNDACLSPHKTERSVKTASVTQVRQPVYTSSVERWRRYEAHLQPLIDALGEYAPIIK